MSKTKEILKKKDIPISEKALEILEGLETDWDSGNSVSLFEDEDGYDRHRYYYDSDCDVTIITHDIFDGESDGRVTVFDGVKKGKLTWEFILNDSLFDLSEWSIQYDEEETE